MVPSLVHLHNQLDPATIISHLSIALVGMAFSVLLLLVILSVRRLPKKSAYALSMFAVALAAAIVALIDIALFNRVHDLFGKEHAPNTAFMVKLTSNFAIFVSQFSVIAVTFWMLQALEANRNREVEIEQARRVVAEVNDAANRAKLAALRYQLNPHFLFNTLNSISSLVVTRRNGDAEKMIANLSEFLRTTLAGDPNADQTLEGELETIDAYLALERIRFGDRLAIEIDCPATLREAKLPHFLLQPLVENAVKHGLAPSDNPVTIRVSARAQASELLVAVENDVDGSGASSHSNGVGLRNVRERLEAVYGSNGRLETMEREAGYIALVRLPLEYANP